MRVGGGADGEEDDKEEGVEVEEGGLGGWLEGWRYGEWKVREGLKRKDGGRSVVLAV